MPTVLLLCLTVLLGSPLAAGDAILALFDARDARGPLAEGGPGRIRAGTSEFALADIDTLVLGEGRPAAVTGSLGVLLVDGSWLPATALAAAIKRDAIAVTGPLGILEVPLTAIVGWGAPGLPPAGEGDAVQVASGVLRGRILGLRDGSLSFASTVDPEPLSLPLAEVRALRLGVPPAAAPTLRLRAILDPARPPLDLVLSGGRPALAAAPTVTLDPARLGSLPLRVEGGRRVYLSDLKPSRLREDGAFGVVWPYARDSAIGGGPLLLGGTRFAKGLSVHAAAELAWDLAAGFQRLRVRIGISDQVLPEGDCLASLSGDGRELWHARVRGGELPRTLDLDLNGVRELVLRIELGERHDIGDHLVLADAQLIRKP